MLGKQPPSVDIYGAGFPCQNFSQQGLGEGMSSDGPNALVGLACLNYISDKRPRAFLLENVANLSSKKHWRDFALIMNVLTQVCEPDGSRTYRVTWKVVDATDCGTPQSRPRLYIVGLQKEKKNQEFKWPPPVPMKPLSEFLDSDTKEPPEMPTSKTQQTNYLRCIEHIYRTGHKHTDDFIADLGE